MPEVFYDTNPCIVHVSADAITIISEAPWVNEDQKVLVYEFREVKFISFHDREAKWYEPALRTLKTALSFLLGADAGRLQPTFSLRMKIQSKSGNSHFIQVNDRSKKEIEELKTRIFSSLKRYREMLG
jgi:hypothetical protein